VQIVRSQEEEEHGNDCKFLHEVKSNSVSSSIPTVASHYAASKTI